VRGDASECIADDEGGEGTGSMIASPSSLEVYLLGHVELDDALALQRRLAYDVGEADRGGALILCEHPPVITVGRNGSRRHIRPDDRQLAAAGIPTRWVARGGGCVLHLPGQLCAYLVLPLQRLGLHLQAYLDRLHDSIVRVLAEFDLAGELHPDVPGVFLGHARVASVGVSVNRWITGYGLTLNVGPYLAAFDLLDEPGIGARPLHQTSMESRRQRPAPMAKVREALIREIESAFGLSWHHVYTDHPMVRRPARAHAYVSIPG
jgi:lipoyl(octanoyl) transferase